MTAELFWTPHGDDVLVKGTEAFLFIYFIVKKEKVGGFSLWHDLFDTSAELVCWRHRPCRDVCSASTVR